MGPHSAPTSGIFNRIVQSQLWESGIGTISQMRPRDVLAANLRKLMAAAPGLSRLPQIINASNGALSNGTLDRVRRASTGTNVDTLEAIAEVFGVEAWQLLVPTLQAAAAEEADQAKVTLSGLPDWPLTHIDRRKFLALPAEQRAFIEGMIARELEILEAPDTSDLKRFQSAHPPAAKRQQRKRSA